MTAAAYLLLWKSALHWTGKWPAPYWFAVGLGVLLAYGILTPKKVHLTWVIPFACFSIVVAWFFGLGIYQTWARTVILHDYRWYYHNDWPARVPTIALMGAFVFSDQPWIFLILRNPFLFFDRGKRWLLK